MAPGLEMRGIMRAIAILSALLLQKGCDGHPVEEAEKKGTTEISREERDEIKSYLEAQIRAGYDTIDAAVESTVEAFIDEHDADSLRRIARLLGVEILARILAETASWPEVTDCDRLDAAFEELQSAGIVARQNFSCCGTCGAAEIGDEIDAEVKKGTKVRGYAFFHMQDTESAVEGYGLYLSYGSVTEGEEAALGTGEEIVDTLEKHGLKTEWDGTWENRIHLQLDWKRRGPWFDAGGRRTGPDPRPGDRQNTGTRARH